MFSRSNRLRGRATIDRALRQRPTPGQFVTLKATPNVLGLPRVTVVASTKVSKRAVERNKLKRQCREILRQLLAKQGVDLVLALRVGAKGVPFSLLRGDIKNCLTKRNINVVK